MESFPMGPADHIHYLASGMNPYTQTGRVRKLTFPSQSTSGGTFFWFSKKGAGFTPLPGLALLDEKARLINVARWIAGNPDPLKGDELWLGLWDEGYIGRPPDSHSAMPDCIGLQEYSRGAEGWAYDQVSRSLTNTKPYAHLETVKDREITHLVIGDSKFIQFHIAVSNPVILKVGNTLDIHPGRLCFNV